MTLFTRILLLAIFLFAAILSAFSQGTGSNDCTQTFQKVYTGFGIAAGNRSLFELNDGTLLSTGTASFAPPLTPVNTSLLTRFNKKGDLLSSKAIWYKDYGTILSAVKHIDGSVFTISNASVGNTYSVAYTKYDPQLNLQWEKIFQPPLAFDCTVDTAGNTYVGSMIGQFNFFQHLVITRFNPDGQTGFRYQYNFNDPFAAYGNPGRICYFNNRLYVTMELNKYLRWYTLLLCINPVDGSVDWSHMMAVDGPYADLNAVEQLFSYQGKLCMVNSLYRGGGFNGATLIELDAGGQPLEVRRFSIGPQQPFFMRFLPDRDGNLVVSGNAYDYSVTPAGPLRMFMRINPLFNILNCRKWVPPSLTYELDRVASADGAIYEMGVHNETGSEFYLRRSDPGGKTGDCPYDTLLVNVQTATISYTNLPFTRQAEPITPVVLERMEAPVGINFIKADCSDCDTLFIEGPGVFCDTTPYLLKAVRMPGCTNAINWNLADENIAKITTLTDSTIALQFRKSGSVMLKATLFGGCRAQADSVLLTAHIPWGIPDLGVDTSLCSIPLTLHAQPGYKSYQWQNNSTDSIYLVRQPGKYFVTATNFCGRVFSDTVTLSAGLSAPIALGPDTSFCFGDSLILDAGNQFVSYQWNTGSTAAAITLHVPGAYWVSATAASGCISRDTLIIKSVNSLPVVSLDHNPVICKNNSRILVPAGRFASYTWNDGSVAPSLTIHHTGIYWVVVKDDQGCEGSDTVSISIQREGPSAFLQADTFFCPSVGLQLLAPPGFALYKWSNGAQKPAIAVTQAGVYTLQVTDKDGCTGYDSVRVIEKDCVSGIWFPDAFTPNGDNANELYRPVVRGTPVLYKFCIYNRFGQLLFTSTDYHQGWNGTAVGKRQDIGGYAWTCSWQFSGQLSQFRKGNLLLLK